jgi:hypothetical protein
LNVSPAFIGTSLPADDLRANRRIVPFGGVDHVFGELEDLFDSDDPLAGRIAAQGAFKRVVWPACLSLDARMFSPAATDASRKRVA